MEEITIAVVRIFTREEKVNCSGELLLSWIGQEREGLSSMAVKIMRSRVLGRKQGSGDFITEARGDFRGFFGAPRRVWRANRAPHIWQIFLRQRPCGAVASLTLVKNQTPA